MGISFGLRKSFNPSDFCVSLKVARNQIMFSSSAKYCNHKNMHLRTVVSLEELPMVKGGSIFRSNTSFVLLNEDGENGKVKFQTRGKLCSR